MKAGIAGLVAAVLVLAGAAHAETVIMSCQPDHVKEVDEMRLLKPDQQARGIHRRLFAYDLATGKACDVDATWKACTTNLSAQLSESGAVLIRTNGGPSSLLLISPSGSFRREGKGAYEMNGAAGACTRVEDMTVDLNQRPDPRN